MEQQLAAEGDVISRRAPPGRLATAAVALLLVGACLAYDRTLVDAFSLPKKGLCTLGGLGLLGLVLLGRAWRGRPLKVPGEILLSGGFLGAAAVSLARSQAPAAGLDLVGNAVRLVAWWGVGLLLLAGPRRLAVVLAALWISGVVVATVGLVQYFELESWLKHVWKESVGTDIWGKGRPAVPFVDLPQVDRPASVFGHVNVASHVVVIGVLAGLGLLLPSPLATWRRGSFRVRGLVLLGGLLVALLYLAVGGSRAAWLGLAAGGAVLVVLVLAGERGGRARRTVLVGTGAAALAAFLGLLLVDAWVRVPGRGGGPDVRPSERLLELADLDSGTLGERRVLWANTWEMVRSAPVAGVGPGNWKVAYPAWSRAARVHEEGFTLRRQPERAHCDPLQVLAETGVVGLVLLLAFLLAAGVRLARGTVRLVGLAAASRRAAVGVCAGVVVISLASFPFQEPIPGTVVFLLLGAGAGLGGGAAPRGLRLAPATQGGVAVVALLLFVVAGFHFNGRMVADRSWQASQGVVHAALVGAQDRSAVELGGRQLVLRALAEADLAAARDPGRPRYPLQRARVLLRLGLGDDALAVVDRALELHPNLAGALMLRAQLVLLRAGPAAARLVLVRALHLLPQAPELWLLMGRVYEGMGLLASDAAGRLLAGKLAAGSYRKAAGGREYMPWAHLGLARLGLEQGGPVDKAVAHLEKAAENAWHEPGLLARVARLCGHPRLKGRGGGYGLGGRRTLELWGRVRDLTGGRHAEARMELALAPVTRALASSEPLPPQKDLRRMLAEVEGILEEDPANVDARYYRAVLLEGLGEYDGALTEWANLARWGQMTRFQSPWLRRILDQAVRAAERIRMVKVEQALGGARGGGR